MGADVMKKIRGKSLVTMLVLLLAPLVAPAVAANELNGIWQHEEDPVWVEIGFEGEQGNGVILRNNKNAEVVGFELLKKLTPHEKKSLTWTGQVYAQQLEEYKKATVTLPEPDVMRLKVKVGFLSKTIEWNRVSGLP